MADGAGGKEVGRISVRVVPNTNKFRARLKEQLEEIEKGESVDVDVNADMDAAKVLAKFKAMMKAMREQAAKGVPVEPKVKPESATRELDSFQKRLLSELNKSTQKIEAKIPLTVDGEKFRRQLAQHVKNVETRIRANIPVEFGAANKYRSDLGAEIKQLQKISGEAEQSRSRFSRLTTSLRELGSGFGNALGNIRPFGIGLLGIVAIASLLAPALALLTGVLLSIPALIAAIALPIGAVALGMDGIKNAAKTLAPEVEKLKAAMSSRFEERLTPVFERMKAIFPVLQENMPKLADSLSSVFSSMTSVLTGDKGRSQIENIINNVATAVDRSKTGVQDFTSAILTLISAVSNKLPGLSSVFNEYANRFLNWVNQITTVGPDGVSQLDTALSAIKATLTGLLDLVGNLGSLGLDTLIDPEFITNLKVFINLIVNSLPVVVPVLAAAFEGVVRIMSGIRNLFNFLSGDWSNVSGPLQTLVIGLQAVTGAVEAVYNAVTSKLPDIGTIITAAFGGIPTAVSEAFSGIVPSVSDIMGQVVSTFTGGGNQIVSEVGTWPGKIVSALGDLGSLLFNSGASVVSGFVAGIRSRLGDVASAAGELMSRARSFFPFSPAKEGPFSGRGWVTYSGESIAQGLADGITNKAEVAAGAAKDLVKGVNDQLSQVADLGKQGVDIGANFARANLQQFQSDLGIGGGAASSIAEQGLGWAQGLLGNTFNIQVGSVDDAMRIKNNELNRQGLQWNGG
ncbi:hypothetical protein [Mycobacteroides chelonae]|uniref:phage tail protein n=1 Tax=Mycobacteroides chelonae TaxID=1774 RepID=UPI0005C54E03|nr:hypothetical protein [Mycobacteroides chelonae]OHT67765.1 hypothetical protein BKG66_24355 [Mycobacteroides chelonae]OHT69408.1 hypothetical protein BKG67_22890 [Mycobacteroides chelonae]